MTLNFSNYWNDQVREADRTSRTDRVKARRTFTVVRHRRTYLVRSTCPGGTPVTEARCDSMDTAEFIRDCLERRESGAGAAAGVSEQYT